MMSKLMPENSNVQTLFLCPSKLLEYNRQPIQVGYFLEIGKQDKSNKNAMHKQERM